jgi:hypothetical protein
VGKDNMIIQTNSHGVPLYALFTQGPEVPSNPNAGHIHVTADVYRYGGAIYSNQEPSDTTVFWVKTTQGTDVQIQGGYWFLGDAEWFSGYTFGVDGVYKWDGSAWVGASGALIYDGSKWKPAAPTIVDLSNWVLSVNLEPYGKGSYAGGVLTLKGEKAYGGANDAYWSSYTANDMIDLTPYSQVKAHILSAKSSGWLFVNTNRGDLDKWLSAWLDNLNTKVSIAQTDNETDVSLDVSELSGQYYVGFVVNATGEIKSNKVWLS